MPKSTKSVVVIGKENSGMTTLLTRLSDDQWSGSSTTLCRVNFMTADDDELSLQLMELDKYSQGRDYLSDTYTSTADVIIIIQDCSTSYGSQQMLLQLQTIHKQRPTVPIVLVTSKCDDGLLRKSDDGYSLFSHVSTSCKTGLGINDLKTVLFRAAFPVEMKRSEQWYKVILNWKGFGRVFSCSFAKSLNSRNSMSSRQKTSSTQLPVARKSSSTLCLSTTKVPFRRQWSATRSNSCKRL